MACVIQVDESEFQGIKVCDEINDNGFLMSLMEELQDHQVEEGDEERLNSVIQSLEAEINANSLFDDFDRQMDGQNWSGSLDELDMDGWNNVDMEYDMNLYTYPSEDHEMMSNDVIGFGGVVGTNYLGDALDLDQYGSLWQETVYYEPLMYQ